MQPQSPKGLRFFVLGVNLNKNAYGNFFGYVLLYAQSIIFLAVFFFCGVCRVCKSDKKI